MANDIFGNVKSYFSKLTDGEKSATEIASSLNTWLRESGESIKTKIEEEVQSAVKKMGFIKREEFDALKKEVYALQGKKLPVKKVAKSAAKNPAKKATKKATSKPAAPKKRSVKKVAKAPVKKKATGSKKS